MIYFKIFHPYFKHFYTNLVYMGNRYNVCSMGHRLYNLKKLEEISQGDEVFVRDMVAEFVHNVTGSIENILSFKPLEKWTSIAETAHKLVSNFAYLGADMLQALAADIEKSVLSDADLTGIDVKTEKMCNDGLLLINQLKERFGIIDG